MYKMSRARSERLHIAHIKNSISGLKMMFFSAIVNIIQDMPKCKFKGVITQEAVVDALGLLGVCTVISYQLM